MKPLLQLITVSLLGIILVLFTGCKKDEQATGTDAELFIMAKETSGFVWYKKKDVLLPRSE